MTQPTQEDLERIHEELLGTKIYRGGFGNHTFLGKDGIHYPVSGLPNPYTDDSFTGALVKAVCPLLADYGYIIVPMVSDDPNRDNDFAIWHWEKDRILLRASYLNTALIEAWKKIEGEKK